MTVNCQAQHESSDTDTYRLKNYYNPSALAIFLKCTTHHVGGHQMNRKEMLKQLRATEGQGHYAAQLY